MKKFVSIILSMIIILSAFSITTFAYTPKAKEAIKNINFKDGLVLTITGYSESENIEIYFKENKAACNLSIDGFDLTVISIDDAFYVYLTKFPFFYFETNIYEEIFPTDIFYDSEFEADYVENYIKTIDSTTYNIEKYAYDDENTVECYFLGETLKIIESKSEDFLVRFEITTEINDEKFRLPPFAINITPIINLLFGEI